jgi:hypothetical protein
MIFYLYNYIVLNLTIRTPKNSDKAETRSNYHYTPKERDEQSCYDISECLRVKQSQICIAVMIYLIFKAVEDSPQQKSRVAVLLVVVVAPSDPFSDQHKASPTARLALKIACAFILMAFICGVVVIVHHRYTLSRAKVSSLLL